MKVIALDNRGVGKSSRPNYPYTMEMFVNDIKNLLADLNIQEAIHLCGISMGGMIAQNFVLKYPYKVKTLILCATAAKIDPTPLIEQHIHMKEYDSKQIFMALIPLLYSRSFRKKLKEDKNLFELLRTNFMEDPTRFQDYMNQSAAILAHDTCASLHKIKQPTLILMGTKDRLVPQMSLKFMHEKISNSKLVLLNNLGHNFVIEQPDKLNNLIWSFIEEFLG